MKLRNKKTGEISTNPLISVAPFTGGVRGCHVRTYRSAGEFNAEWEDYNPKEPLIKNKEIRKIIRLWAKVNGVVGLTYNAPENSLTDIFRNEISFNGRLGLDDGCFYTANELCGEEEE